MIFGISILIDVKRSRMLFTYFFKENYLHFQKITTNTCLHLKKRKKKN